MAKVFYINLNILLALTLLGSRGMAIPAPIPVPSPTPPTAAESLKDTVVKDDIAITKKIRSFAKDVDFSLAGKKIVDEENPTRVVIRNQLYWSQRNSFSYTPHFDLQLRLPNLERKWALKFTTYDENQETLGVNKDRIRTTPLSDNPGTGLYFFQKLGEVSAEFQPQLEYINQVELSYLLKLKSTARTSFLVFKPELQLFARSDTGTGEYFAGNLDFPVYKSLVFSLLNEEQYVDRANLFSTNNGVSFGYAYNDVMTQSYALIYELSSRPNYQLTRYTVSTAFNHRLYKNVFHYIIQPYLAFSADIGYVISPGCNLELDLIF